MRATDAGRCPLQKSHLSSPTLPFAHVGQIQAMSVSVVRLQKSHHASPARPSAQDSQMRASTTWEENLLQKLQRWAVTCDSFRPP